MTKENISETENRGYYVTVGMEVHAELKTKSKMWCGCANIPLETSPNKNICEICTAQPGTLPVANREAIKHMVNIGLAVDANISDFTEFDRKNYFYPDIPKAYQITQYKYPIVSGGVLENIPLTRIHLEEDTAKSDHAQGSYTLIDFNRAGVPLMELVTDPVTYDNKEEASKKSANFGKALQRLLRTLGASDADMEKGQMRLEANISVTKDKNVFGVKCEVKNLNSFNSVERAIQFEVDRHIDLIETGGTVLQETRGWDETKMETFSQRKKENAHDYRYFPDPDLPKMYLHSIFDLNALKVALPELPTAKKNRLTEIGLQEKQIEQLLDDTYMGKYFTDASENLNTEEKKTFANYLCSDAVGFMSKDNTLKLPDAKNFAGIIKMISENKLSSRGAKDLLLDIMKTDVEVSEIENRAKVLNLIQVVDTESLTKIVNTVIAENEAQWTEYKNGADKLLMFFVGKCMKASNGAGNPALYTDIIVNSKLH
jgi:aspartyl-tRNA(Asn)/glutamyl-tRNA(Gln) amidotransferase subunit B